MVARLTTQQSERTPRTSGGGVETLSLHGGDKGQRTGGKDSTAAPARQLHLGQSGYMPRTAAARRLGITPNRLDLLAAKYGVIITGWQQGKSEGGVIASSDVVALGRIVAAERQVREGQHRIQPSRTGRIWLPPLGSDYQVVAAAFRLRGRKVMDSRGYMSSCYEIAEVEVTEGCIVPIIVQLDQPTNGKYRMALTNESGDCWLRQVVAEYQPGEPDSPLNVELTKLIRAAAPEMADVEVVNSVLAQVIVELREQVITEYAQRLVPQAL